MPEPSRRLVLRVTTKLLSLTALMFIIYILFSGGDNETTSSSIAPLLVELGTTHQLQAQRLEWAGGPLQLVQTDNNASLYLFYDQGGKLHCPLKWQPPGAKQAPQQPWQGGFRDQCSGIWYHYNGQVLPGQASEQNLKTPPYRLHDGHLLEIGVSGDNAAP